MAEVKEDNNKVVKIKEKNLFNRFIQPGRLCLIEYGQYTGKLCFIIDIITLTRVIIDGAKLTGVPRTIIPVKRLKVLNLRLKVNRGCKSSVIRKKLKKNDILQKFKESNLGRRMIIKAKRDSANDFERFKIYFAKKQLKKKINNLRRKELLEKKKAKKAKKAKTEKKPKTTKKDKTEKNVKIEEK